MMRSRFDEQLATPNNGMARTGAMCEEVIADAAKALAAGDTKPAEHMIPLDGETDQMGRLSCG